MGSQRPGKRPERPRIDFGRAVTRILCALLALVGALPLTLGLLLRTAAVRERASRETEALIQRLVGVKAS